MGRQRAPISIPWAADELLVGFHELSWVSCGRPWTPVPPVGFHWSLVVFHGLPVACHWSPGRSHGSP